MKLFLVFLMMISSAAFAGEKLTFNTEFSITKCTSGYDGEICHSVIEPMPGQVQTIELRSVAAGMKTGSVTLEKETEAGYFQVRVTIQKAGVEYSLFVTFIDPEGDEINLDPVTFTRPSEYIRSSGEGAVWNLGEGSYLIPSFLISNM